MKGKGAHDITVVHGPSSLGLDPKDPAIRVKSLLKAFCQFEAAGTRSTNHTIDSPSPNDIFSCTNIILAVNKSNDPF